MLSEVNCSINNKWKLTFDDSPIRKVNFDSCLLSDYRYVPNFGRQSSGMEPGRPGGGGECWGRGSPHPTAAAAVAAACHVDE